MWIKNKINVIFTCILCFATISCLGCNPSVNKYKSQFQYTNEKGIEVYSWPKADEEGMIDVTGGKISYKLYGKDKKGIPIICLHGGPGGDCGSFYGQLPLSEERPLVLYNQLGSPETEVNPEFHNRNRLNEIFTIDNFTKELDTVIKYFNFDKYILYGTSWGTMLAVEYVSKYHPEGLVGCILAGACLNVDRWTDDQNKIIMTLPNGKQFIDEMNKCQQTGVYTDLFWENDKIYMRSFNNRHKEETKDRPYMVGYDGSDEPKYDGISSYEYMWGKTEYLCTGTLNHHDSIKCLKDIHVPILYIAGEYDEVLPKTLEFYASQNEQTEISIIPGSGHASANEAPNDVSTIIKKFIAKLN